MGSLEDIRNKFIVDKENPKEIKKEINENNSKEKTLLEISKLISFRKGQPFSLYDEQRKENMKESILKNGVIFPVIVRKIENELYEILSGHNRVICCKELGLSTIPAEIVECDDEKATLIMLDTNLCNREKILPVEKGYAYKMRLEVLNHQGKSLDLTNGQNVQKLQSAEIVGKENNESGRQVRRYIRLTELIKPLQEKVNLDKIPVIAGVELSYLSEEEQEIVNAVIEDEQIKISLVQAQKIRLKKNQISYELVLKILKNEKIKIEKFTGKIEKRAFKIYKDKFKSDKEFTDLILDLLDKYFSSDSE